MKKIIIGAIVALILFIVLLLSLAPARVIAPWIADKFPALTLSNIQGSVWNIQIDSAQFKRFKLENITLSTSPLPLLWGSLNSDLSVDDQNIRLDSQLALSNADYQLAAAQFDIDTAYIAQQVTIPIKGLSGRVKGQIQEFHWLEKKLQALQGEGVWHDAIIEYPNNNLELGDIRFKLSQAEADNSARIDIVENQGVLDLKGFIEVSLNKNFNMKLSTTSSLPAHLKSWVTRWGRLQGDRINLEWRGRLP